MWVETQNEEVEMVKDRVWQIVLDLIDRDLIERVDKVKYAVQVSDIAVDIIDLVCDIENDLWEGNESDGCDDSNPMHPDNKEGWSR